MQKCPIANFFGLNKCFENIDKQKLLIGYKLLHDSLFLALLSLLVSLILEGILPGIITAHIGFSKIVIGILINIFLIQSLAGKIPSEKTTSARRPNKSELVLLFILALIGMALLFNAQLKINNALNLFIVLCFLAIGYLLYDVFFSDTDTKI